MKRTELILALDTDDTTEILYLLKNLQGIVRWVKVGYAALTSLGVASMMREAKRCDYNIFIDTKFHDSPSQTAAYIRHLARYGVQMLTVHVSGGLDMMRAAKAAAQAGAIEHGLQAPHVVGVSVLTSNAASPTHVLALAQHAQHAGLDGIVASVQDINRIRGACGEHFTIITPGIRCAEDSPDDHGRYGTPYDAAMQGATFIVVGRPILHAPDPVHAAYRIQKELELPCRYGV